MKEYTYNDKSFLMEVTITGLFCGFITIVCLILACLGFLSGLMVFIAIVAGYSFWNCFISKSNSQKVILDDDYISFKTYNREDRFAFNDIKRLRIREFPTSGKMYIRINDSTAFKGRYWIQTKVFSDGNELFRKLLDIEYEMHPDTLKARARRVNTEYMEAEKKAGPVVKKKKFMGRDLYIKSRKKKV